MSIRDFDFKTGKSIDPRRFQVVVVVDGDDDREVLHQAVREKKYRMMGQAQESRAALELLRKHKMGVLFLDMDMEGIDAGEIMSQVQRRFKDFAVVMLSGTVTRERIAEAKEMGAGDFMVKPLKKEAVSTVLDRVKAK